MDPGTWTPVVRQAHRSELSYSLSSTNHAWSLLAPQHHHSLTGAAVQMGCTQQTAKRPGGRPPWCPVLQVVCGTVPP